MEQAPEALRALSCRRQLALIIITPGTGSVLPRCTADSEPCFKRYSARRSSTKINLRLRPLLFRPRRIFDAAFLGAPTGYTDKGEDQR